MKVLVAGATGAMGKQLLPRLAAEGHDVTGIARSEEKASACIRRSCASESRAASSSPLIRCSASRRKTAKSLSSPTSSTRRTWRVLWRRPSPT